MTMPSLGVSLLVALWGIASPVVAQHETHQAATAQMPSAEMTQCLQVQPVLVNIIAAAMNRAEVARLSNSPSELRAAVEHLQSALRDIRTQMSPCSTAAASADPHAGHSMAADPATAPPAQAPAGATDPHAGHVMPAPAPTNAAPAVPKVDPAKPADPHAGHMPDQSSGMQMDPVNGLMVDPAKAPKATYQGQTYYFSSEQTRKEFLENPAKFAKKPRG